MTPWGVVLAGARSVVGGAAAALRRLRELPRVGDKMYVPSQLHLTHGRDDFAGGVCTVAEVRHDMSKGRLVTFVTVKEDPDAWYNWDGYLAPNQAEWRAEYGDRPGGPAPDFRPEFNED